MFYQIFIFKLAGKEFCGNFLLFRMATFITYKVNTNLGIIMKSLKSWEMILEIFAVVNKIIDAREIKRIDGIDVKE